MQGQSREDPVCQYESDFVLPSRNEALIREAERRARVEKQSIV